MSAKQEQIELFVAEATHSLGSVRRSLDVVALGNAELSSAVVSVARSMGEAATRFDLADMADICAVVTEQVPQVAMEELPQRDLWEPLFEALQAAIDAVAVGQTPSARAMVAAIAHLKGEATNDDRGAELETSYAELGLAEFALEEDLFADAAEPTVDGGGDWSAEEVDHAFATAEDLFTSAADGLSDLEDLAIAAPKEVNLEESAGELLFTDTALFESMEPAAENDAFGFIGLLGEEVTTVAEQTSSEAFAEMTALFGSDVAEREGEETPELFEFDEGLVTSLSTKQVSDAEGLEGLPRASLFQENFEEAIAAEAGGFADFADLFAGSTEGDDIEELTAVQLEEPATETVVETAAEVAEFSDLGDVFGEADGSAEIEGLVEVAAEEQATLETEDTAAEGGDFANFAGLFEGSTESDDLEELTAVQPEEPATETVVEMAAEVAEFSDLEDVFGEADGSAEIEGLVEVAAEEQATLETEDTAAEAGDFADFAGLFEGSTESDDLEELTAVQPEEPTTEAVAEMAAEVAEFSDLGDVFGEADGSAEVEGIEGLAEVATEEQATPATEDTAAEAGDFGDFADLFEGSTESDDIEELTAVQLEESATETVAEMAAEVAEFSDFGDVFGEADGSAEVEGIEGLVEVAAEEQAAPATEGTTAEAGDFADLAGLFEGSTEGDDMEELTAVQPEEPATEAVAEMAAEVAEFSDFGDVLEEAGGSARVEELVEIDLPESTTEEVRVVPGTDEFSSLGDLLEEVPENNEIEELTGSEPIEMTSDVSAEAAEEVTEFPDFEDVFGENSEELAGIATENLAVEGMESVDFGNTSDASLEQNESEFVASASELEMDFANVLSEVEDSVQADSAVSIGGTDVEPQHEESAEDLTELAGLFGDVSMDAVQGGDGALSGLNLDAEAENYTSEIHNAADVGGDETNEEDLGLGELFDGLSDADIVAIADSPSERGDGEFSSMDDLENFLGVAENGESSPTLDVLSDYFDSSFGEEGTDAASTTPETGADSGLDNLDDLEGLLTGSLPGETSGLESLDSLLVDAGPTTAPVADDFADLSSLLDSTIGRASVPNRPVAGGDGKKSSQRVTAMKVKVDVTYLDSLNNLVGELVVNRNLLASDSERMQGFIGNLLNQVQQLSEVSQKMRDTFDRSVLETSVIASRPRGFSGFQQMLVVDRDRAGGESNNDPHDIRSRFTGDTFDTYNEYHVLSQEIIELIVKIKESTSDIEFVVSETDQVTRQLGTITTQVQDNLKQLRMLPFSQLTDRLPRGVRDRALQANKKADIAFEGTDTLVDKAILEQLQDPMVHLVNNAIDHGIEDPETRRQRGKPEAGQLTVRAYHQGNQTVITVSDDGGGIDPEKVKQSAIRKGLLTPAEAAKLSDLEAFNLIFRPGFSTAAVADMYKGRGVGMDVVKSSIEEIRGSILTESEVGKGTTFTIRLPLTLSITKAMSCVSNRNKIAFPVDSVEDMLEIPRNQIQLNSKGEPTLPWRDIMLPFLPLSSLLTYNRQISRGSVYGKQDEDILSILVLRNDNNFLALQTDQIIGESEIVIKQLEGPVPQPPGIAGATILGDGRVMAIANVLELFDIASGRLRFKFDVAEPPQELDEQHDPIVLIVDDSITVRELLSVTFSKVGYRVEQARDGLDAWDKLRAGLPCDLIFCDIEMPKMDGLELLSRVKKDETLKKIPMAMLTSRGADRHRQTARELGANGYFTKPYLEEEVITASKRLLKGERLLDSHS